MTYMGPMPYENYIRFNKNHLPAGVTLLTKDGPALPSSWNSTAAHENEIDLPWYYVDAIGNKNSDITVSSSKPGVVSAEYTGGEVYLRAVAAGTSTITVKSADGVLKHSFPVKVVNPIGSVRISSAGPGGANAVAFGKSLKLSAKTLDTYGKPTGTKLTWRIINVCDRNYHTLTPEQYKSVLSISQSGVLTAKAGASKLNLERATVAVYPTDYTRYASMSDNDLASYNSRDLIDKVTVYFCDPVKKLSSNTPKTVEFSDTTTTYALYTVTLNDGSIGCYNSSSVNDLISVTSSKPNLVSVKVTRSGMAHYNIALYGNPDALGDTSGKSATAKITVKAVDGSGKSFSFNVKVTKNTAG